jgi:GNAT superfamily N-acetyltransferase
MVRTMTETTAAPGPSASVPADVELVDLRDRQDEDLLARVHDGLYTASFPREEEREDLATLRAALWGDSRDRPPVTHFVVACAGDVVLGLVVCEYYPRSRSGLVSYVAVDEAARGQGLGRRLVERAIALLRADADAAGAQLAAAFAEIHDPAKLAAWDDEVMRPLDRVRAMASFGAKRVPVAYVQPALAQGGDRARTLMLIAFPPGPGTFETLPALVVRGFLEELYETLDVERPREDVDFVRSLVGLTADDVELAPLVPVEQPLLDEVTEYGIGIHLPVRNPRAAGIGSEAELRSFEDDILAYAFRESPPFRTRAVPVREEWARVAVEFAGEITFLSEGRRVTFLSSQARHLSLRSADPQGRTRRFLLRASRTDFETSDLSILHLVLGPDPASDETALHEWDLIKLMKLWNGGEGVSVDGVDADGRQFLRFVAGGEEVTLLELARHVFGEDVEPGAPRVGTVQILHPACESGICDAIRDVVDRQGAAELEPAMQDAVTAAGGIFQGLLDFEEIDNDELADVFKGVQVEDELLSAVHKGTLLVISATDRAFSAENVRLTIGLSPYLLVPHAVLLHNEWWLRDAVKQLDAAAEPGRSKGKRLETARAEVGRTLSRRLVPNVFHYPEERRLYAVGRRSRGLQSQQAAVEKRLAAVKSELGARSERVKNGVAKALPVLALVFTWNDALAKHDHTLVLAVLVPVTVLTLAALAFVFSRD